MPNSNPAIAKIQSWLPASLRHKDFDLGARIGGKAQEIIAGVLIFTGALRRRSIQLSDKLHHHDCGSVFSLRDSSYFAESVRRISPLTDAEENMFVDRFRTVAQATVVARW